jgi:signal transduction histidine kinase
MRAHKVFVDENFLGEDGRLYARVTHEYIRPEYVSLADPEIYFDEETGTVEHYSFCYDDIPNMRDQLAAGGDVIVYPESEPESVQLGYSGNEKAELNIPIFASGRWVGSAVFQDYVDARDWESDEKRLLHTVAAMIGAFWERNKSRQLLEDLLKSKDEFVASVSHELRTPLTAVVGLAQELHHNGFTFGKEEAQDLIALIAEQSLDVANIVEDLLVAARAGTGALTVIPGEVDLRGEIAAILAGNLILPADDEGVPIEGDAETAWADPTRVRQILRNLLTNAVRYGGDAVRVTLSSTRDTACLRVHDSGDPIPTDAHDRIFKPYQRAHSIPSQPASVGLGLSVSLQLAELMHGSLTYEHTGGESVFTLTLPTARSLSAV